MGSIDRVPVFRHFLELLLHGVSDGRQQRGGGRVGAAEDEVDGPVGGEEEALGDVAHAGHSLQAGGGAVGAPSLGRALEGLLRVRNDAKELKKKEITSKLILMSTTLSK